ncbi:SDR family oxidoreductase [Cochlodiniinecator piscidefendens]|uniref:SDR family oxidoreductase n=1 Tax=Cochlodiniinecator piscidefendens TaxID=2715756 RepID=UPI00140AFD73|nr:NmrA family NAD(P)-binding protein [Cochlodiniinecator piscidefendens]
MNHTVAIFGATGAQGAPVVQEALAKGMTVRAVARDEAKIKSMHPQAQAYPAVMDDEEALTQVFTGVDAAFVHLPAPETPDDAAVWLKAIIGAAHRAKLALMVFTTSGSSGSRYPASAIIDGGTAAMNAVLSSGLPSIVLQPTIYLENLQIRAFHPKLRDEGVLDYPPLSTETKVTWTSHLDQARIAVAALTRPDLAGRAFEIGTPNAMTGEELATYVGRWIGEEVRYQPTTPEQFGQRVGEAFQNPGMAFAMTDLYGAMKTMGTEDLVVDTNEIQKIFNVQLTQVAEHIQSWQV